MATVVKALARTKFLRAVDKGRKFFTATKTVPSFTFPYGFDEAFH